MEKLWCSSSYKWFCKLQRKYIPSSDSEKLYIYFLNAIFWRDFCHSEDCSDDFFKEKCLGVYLYFFHFVILQIAKKDPQISRKSMLGSLVIKKSICFELNVIFDHVILWRSVVSEQVHLVHSRIEVLNRKKSATHSGLKMEKMVQ